MRNCHPLNSIFLVEGRAVNSENNGYRISSVMKLDAAHLEAGTVRLNRGPLHRKPLLKAASSVMTMTLLFACLRPAAYTTADTGTASPDDLVQFFKQVVTNPHDLEHFIATSEAEVHKEVMKRIGGVERLNCELEATLVNVAGPAGTTNRIWAIRQHDKVLLKYYVDAAKIHVQEILGRDGTNTWRYLSDYLMIAPLGVGNREGASGNLEVSLRMRESAIDWVVQLGLPFDPGTVKWEGNHFTGTYEGRTRAGRLEYDGQGALRGAYYTISGDIAPSEWRISYDYADEQPKGRLPDVFRIWRLAGGEMILSSMVWIDSLEFKDAEDETVFMPVGHPITTSARTIIYSNDVAYSFAGGVMRPIRDLASDGQGTNVMRLFFVILMLLLIIAFPVGLLLRNRKQV
jgi:hypothetical protein